MLKGGGGGRDGGGEGKGGSTAALLILLQSFEFLHCLKIQGGYSNQTVIIN